MSVHVCPSTRLSPSASRIDDVRLPRADRQSRPNPTKPDTVKPRGNKKLPPNHRKRTRRRYLPCFQKLGREKRPIFGKTYVSPACPIPDLSASRGDRRLSAIGMPTWPLPTSQKALGRKGREGGKDVVETKLECRSESTKHSTKSAGIQSRCGAPLPGAWATTPERQYGACFEFGGSCAKLRSLWRTETYENLSPVSTAKAN